MKLRFAVAVSRVWASTLLLGPPAVADAATIKNPLCPAENGKLRAGDRPGHYRSTGVHGIGVRIRTEHADRHRVPR